MTQNWKFNKSKISRIWHLPSQFRGSTFCPRRWGRAPGAKAAPDRHSRPLSPSPGRRTGTKLRREMNRLKFLLEIGHAKLLLTVECGDYAVQRGQWNSTIALGEHVDAQRQQHPSFVRRQGAADAGGVRADQIVLQLPGIEKMLISLLQDSRKLNSYSSLSVSIVVLAKLPNPVVIPYTTKI